MREKKGRSTHSPKKKMHRNNCNKNIYEINKEKNKILLRAINIVMQQWEIHTVT